MPVTKPRYPSEPVPVWESFTCRFSNPHVMARLERLMGTKVVTLTDRKYMLKLQSRIHEEHIIATKERIKEREKKELNREKNLILKGRIPLEEAPQELEDHPVFRITQMANEFIKELNQPAKKKSRKMTPEDGDDPCTLLIRKYQRTREHHVSVAAPSPEDELSTAKSYDSSESENSEDSEENDSEDDEGREDKSNEEANGEDDEGPNEMSELEEQKKKRKEERKVEKEARREQKRLDKDAQRRKEEQSDLDNGYIFTDDEYERRHYETEHVKAMWTLETIEDLYDMADQVIKDIVAHRPNDPIEPQLLSQSHSPEKPGPTEPGPIKVERGQNTAIGESETPKSDMNSETKHKKPLSKDKDNKRGKHKMFSWRKRRF